MIRSSSKPPLGPAKRAKFRNSGRRSAEGAGVHANLALMDTSAVEVIRPLRRVEYDQLIKLGAFEDERIELLDGQLVAMSPIGPPHTATVDRLTELLVLALHGRAIVRCQGSFAASELSEPEPDFTVLAKGDYDLEHPSEAHLVIEVAESSLAKDRGRKLRMYASCGIPEYWVVNLPERCVEVYTGPTPGAYANVERYERGQSIRLVAFPDVSLAVEIARARGLSAASRAARSYALPGHAGGARARVGSRPER